jgi:hypothetical protein
MTDILITTGWLMGLAVAGVAAMRLILFALLVCARIVCARAGAERPLAVEVQVFDRTMAA